MNIDEKGFKRPKKRKMFFLNKCSFVKRSAWITRDGIPSVKISSCRRYPGCLNELDSNTSTESEDSDMEGAHICLGLE